MPYNPEIHFEIKEVLSVQGNKVKASGTLSIAGFKKEVIVEGALMENGNKIKISGNHAIDMKDFQIDPPTAMLGTIKVGKDIELKFDITFTKK